MPQIAAGLRNNNPCNIMHDPRNKWVGLATPPADSANRCRFITVEHGIRAAAVLLMAHQDRFGASSVTDHIAGMPNAKGKMEHGWAPAGTAHQNNTNEYIVFVCKKLGVGPRDAIDVSLHATAKTLIKAMCQFENGSMPLTDAQIDRGLTMAGIKPVEAGPSPLAMPGRVAAAGAGTLGAATIAEGMQSAASQLMPFSNFKWVAIACAVLVFAGVCWMLYADYDRRRRGY